MYQVNLEDHVLRELHRAAVEAGRRGISVPSADLDAIARRTGTRQAARRAIQRLAIAERIVRIRKDLLLLPDSTGLLGVNLADLIDAVAAQPYLITGGSALQHHGLTDQHYFDAVVLVPSRVKKLSYRGQTATFLRAHPTNIWGYQEGVRPQYAQPERAIVDAINHPRYAVSLTQAVDALLQAARQDPTFMNRLLQTVIRYGPSAARRAGLIIDRLFGAAAAAPYREHIGTNRAPILMQPSATTHGPLDTTWRVVVNAVLEPERTPA